MEIPLICYEEQFEENVERFPKQFPQKNLVNITLLITGSG